ncbi:hypothetical protein DFJ73DRAFT_377332 [Zopfochytrium polystomum]|nr:hypothetical protein DFJ73DRAFT_377332 [Zopfochytrium polystomum]
MLSWGLRALGAVSAARHSRFSGILSKLTNLLSRGRRNNQPCTLTTSSSSMSQSASTRHVLSWALFWRNYLLGQNNVGSRTPFQGTPEWVTLEVLHGGFASGAHLAGGPLRPFENTLLQEYHAVLERDLASDRLRLNRFFLTDMGREILSRHMTEGTYRIAVPEEAAILSVLLLEQKNDVSAVERILDAITPWMDRLRFYPEFCPSPPAISVNEVFRQSVGDVRSTLHTCADTKPNDRRHQHYMDVTAMMPLFDELVGLFSESVKPTEPKPYFESVDGEEQKVEGGWPCQVYPPGWADRMRSCLDRIKKECAARRRPVNRHSFRYLIEVGGKAVENPAKLSGKEVGRIRFYLAGIAEKRGLPDTDSCRRKREKHRFVPNGTERATVAKVLLARIAHESEHDGLTNPGAFLGPLSDSETSNPFIRGRAPMSSLDRLVRMATKGSLETLMNEGLIPSGEVLATLLPRVAATRTTDDPVLERLYLSTYTAFRSRRSLLLLNYQRQIQFSELPWAAALEAHTLPGTDTAPLILSRVARLFLKAFPEQITPNKLVTELQNLFKNAGREELLLEELAADIFMGDFGLKFSIAARQAIRRLYRTVYGRYYKLPSPGELPQISASPKNADVCGSPRQFGQQAFLGSIVRGRIDTSGNYVVVNGKQIEQAQILTTHNLLALFDVAGLDAADLETMISTTLKRIDSMANQATSASLRWQLRLIICKNVAYAWRQVVFYFAQLEMLEERTKIEELLRSGRSGVTRKLLKDLALCFEPNVGAVPNPLLGWTSQKHWLMTPVIDDVDMAEINQAYFSANQIVES